MDIESGHEEVYKPLTKKHAPPAASRRYALFLTATKVLCLLMVLSLLGYYVYVTVTMDDATAQLVRDVSKLKQHTQHRSNDVPEWFVQVLNLTRKGFVHISLQPFPPPDPITHRRPTTTTHTTTTPTTTTPTTTTSTTTTGTTEPPTSRSTTPTTTSSTTSTTTTSTTSTTENTPEDSTTESTTTTTETANDIELDYAL